MKSSGPFCELVGGAQEEGAVLRITGLIETKHGKLVARGRAGAVQQVFNRSAKGIGNAADVAAELAGAIGLPLSDGAAADLAGGCKFILSEAPGAPQGTDAGADRRLILHANTMAGHF